MKKFFALMVAFAAIAILGCPFLTACSGSERETVEQSSSETTNQTTSDKTENGEEQEHEKEDVDDSGVKHYEVALNMQNFDDFLEYEFIYSYTGVNPEVPNSKGHSYLVTGVLSFAYYQNVIVTFRMMKTDTKQYRDFNIKLNAAGNGGFYQADSIYKEITKQLGGGYGFTVSIQNVSGTVIFDI